MRVATGRDWQSGVLGDTASTGTGNYASATWLGLSEDADAAGDADTRTTWESAVAGDQAELQNVGGGLNRAQAAYSHTPGGSSYQLTKQFVSNANDGTRTVRKYGVLTAARGGGILVFETVLSNPPPLVGSQGDSLTVTVTVNI